MFRPESVLALAAHPDDVEPQAGGTLAMWAAQGIPVTIASIIQVDEPRREEARAAARALGVTYVPYINFASELGYFDSANIVRNIESTIEFDTIITPSEHDSHPDHRKVADLGYQLARRNKVNLLQMSHAIPGGVSGHPFPNLLVRYDPEAAAKKWQAIHAYGDRLAPFALIGARDWYYSGGIGVAEGFTIVKAVNL